MPAVAAFISNSLSSKLSSPSTFFSMFKSFARVFTKSFAMAGLRDVMLVFRLVIDDIKSSADISPSLNPICSD